MTKYVFTGTCICCEQENCNCWDDDDDELQRVEFKPVEDDIELVIHFHLWSKWTPWFQRYNLTFRSTRHCRTCGKEQVRTK